MYFPTHSAQFIDGLLFVDLIVYWASRVLNHEKKKNMNSQDSKVSICRYSILYCDLTHFIRKIRKCKMAHFTRKMCQIERRDEW